jgi:NifB/MoaA-like Fe-S oxidoreductase
MKQQAIFDRDVNPQVIVRHWSSLALPDVELLAL